MRNFSKPLVAAFGAAGLIAITVPAVAQERYGNDQREGWAMEETQPYPGNTSYYPWGSVPVDGWINDPYAQTRQPRDPRNSSTSGGNGYTSN